MDDADFRRPRREIVRMRKRILKESEAEASGATEEGG
jgi:hypothetical protein